MNSDDTAPIPAPTQSMVSAAGLPELKITQVETITLGEFPNLLWVRIHTDQGLSGLGETFVGAQAVAAYIHETVAPYLLGQDARQIERHSRALYGYLGFKSTGVEARGNSAVDIALWDLFGRAIGVPIYQLLGGASRAKIRIYNTCAGYRYVRSKPVQRVDNWGLPSNGDEGPHEDLDAFLYRADDLAKSLLEQGITGMKIWPFDFYAETSHGTYISAAELDTALDPFRKIRRAVGDKMDIMVEFHSLWTLPIARRIIQALEEFNPFWFEDPIKMDNLAALAELVRSTRVPITASEVLGSRWAFRDLLEGHAVGIVMLDPSWCGGFSEAKKIAGMAEAYSLPLTMHACSGPVELTAAVHLSINAPNALIQEIVRAFYTGWYHELVTHLPRIENGFIFPVDGPGLGTDLLPDLPKRKDASIRLTKA